MTPPSARKLVSALTGTAHATPPVWLMRQAGRYLPEYREVRAKAGGFLDLCYTPALAAEVTLQPIRRYGFDAAILFADILLVPDALGQPLTFIEGEGPRLAPIRSAAELATLKPEATRPKFGRVFETVARLRQDLPHATTLIGFCGAPWTVATYMVAGSGSTDQAAARAWAYADPQGFRQLIDLLTEVSVEYLSGQVAAGADVLQIFDTWAGSLPEDEFEQWVLGPTRTIIAKLKARHPGVSILGFPRGAGAVAARFVKETGVDGVSCDTSMPVSVMADLARTTCVQGNLDPLLLVAGGDAMDRRIDTLKAALSGRPYIFNLGHGIVPQTPPEHVGRLVERLRRPL